MLSQTKPAMVYLVGAGPGDPDLVTVRGLKLLREADVVVYDRLVAPALLEEVPPGAELIYVGKAAGFHYREQDQINAILIARASEGLMVVRLKGGDPFVFGRGGEEGLALAEAGIPFEVVPGISSAVAVPAYAGIPVTHRGIANAFTVVTGHACTESAGDTDWEALSRTGTLVILMGLERLCQISASLIECGRPADTPVAVISDGTTLNQQVVVGTLETVGALAKEVPSPATVVVGEVVRLRDKLSWFAPFANPLAVNSLQAIAA